MMSLPFDAVGELARRGVPVSQVRRPPLRPRSPRFQNIARKRKYCRHIHLDVQNPLPMTRVFLHGPRWRRFLVTYEKPNGRVAHHWRRYDFEPDVRELVCEPLQFDRVAMWADPRERL